MRIAFSRKTKVFVPVACRFAVIMVLLARPVIAQVVSSQPPLAPVDGWGFGTSLASSGAALAVGDSAWVEPRWRRSIGATYLYTYVNGNWTQGSTVVAPDAAAGDQFGASVSLSGGALVVGAPIHGKKGAVYYYAVKSGVAAYKQQIGAPDGAASDLFGSSVAISGSTLAVGAYGKTTTLNSKKYSTAGAVYIYTLVSGKWTYQQTLLSPDAAPASARFGYSVALNATNVFIGAPGQTVKKVKAAGAAYAYTLQNKTYTLQSTLTDALPQRLGAFGYSVACNSSTLAVGEPGISSASTYTLAASVWTLQTTLNPMDSSEFGFGHALAMTSTGLAVTCSGSTLSDGTAYLYSNKSGEWSQTARLWAPDSLGANLQFGQAVAYVGAAIVVTHPQSRLSDDYPGLGEAHVYTVSGMKAFASDGLSGDDHGLAVAGNTTTIFVGAPSRSSETGGVYLYKRSATALGTSQRLKSPKLAVGDRFGATLAASDSVLVVGAPGSANSAGAAYVYALVSGVWTLKTTLNPGLLQPGDLFGSSLALSGSTLIIGAPGTSDNTGSVYVYNVSSSGANITAILEADDGQPEDYFGFSVAVDGGNAVIGSPNADSDYENDTGAVYQFAFNNGSWAQVNKATPMGSGIGDFFGATVAISGNRFVAGAPYTGNGSGTIYSYAFDINGATLDARITNIWGALFGDAIALSGDTLVTRIPDADWFPGGVGVFRFALGGWDFQNLLVPGDCLYADRIGYSISLVGGNILFGAPSANFGAGAAYLY